MGGYNGVDECESSTTWKVQLFGERQVFIEDEAEITSRVGSAERAVHKQFDNGYNY